mmetsp:Transcript_5070/g.13005  ORF Transcript_5070/g.13005 Transcript_5070/m.13005 type:complete len:250 (-) Transcript_5070:480-1229(-)
MNCVVADKKLARSQCSDLGDYHRPPHRIRREAGEYLLARNPSGCDDCASVFNRKMLHLAALRFVESHDHSALERQSTGKLAHVSRRGVDVRRRVDKRNPVSPKPTELLHSVKTFHGHRGRVLRVFQVGHSCGLRQSCKLASAPHCGHTEQTGAGKLAFQDREVELALHNPNGPLPYLDIGREEQRELASCAWRIGRASHARAHPFATESASQTPLFHAVAKGLSVLVATLLEVLRPEQALEDSNGVGLP